MVTMPAQLAAHRIRGEYLELPGLSLTLQQVQRLYCLDSLTSESVLAALVDVNFLTQNDFGRYVRRDSAPRRWGEAGGTKPRGVGRQAA
jgi:hypothetical protein